ncbi:MAG: hypothetical protein OQJ93_10165 [Ignavibacteriaceae bacterium]|jgi:hypothetical protein|nr:hypothetical protein [Ignavibacteriaceae bacterium]MCW9095454.1 hypothetical protein [Ignavibacteriaceae bacterium]MCW9097742.1 hypothetical protein [Ignavibacteriaceae bacterium]
MKNKFHCLIYLLDPRSWIIIALLFCNALLVAQESTPTDEFPIGSGLSGIPWRRTQWDYYTSYDSSGFNTMVTYSYDINKSRLDRYNLVAYNMDNSDWIMYYSTCYYTKWESEQNQTELLRVGVKHADGEVAYWKDGIDSVLCWSTKGLAGPEDSLVYGPHYRQDNRYKSWQHGDRHDVKYYTRFRMALDKPENADTTLPVCEIKVVYRFQREHTQGPPEPKKDTVFLSRILTVGDFPDSGHFDYFKFDPEWYKYPEHFWLPKDAGKLLYIPEDSVWYNDVNDDIGIQFWVDWLIDIEEDSGYTLYIDKIEVYDEDWKEGYIEHPEVVVNRINTYSEDYCDWPNVKYWIGHDEPYTIDAFTPIRIVDSLLNNNPLCPNQHRLINVFNPYWTYDNQINGDTLLFQYFRMAKPSRLFVDMYPFAPQYPIPRFEDFDYLRYTFQQCHTLQPGFWYQAQGFGQTRNGVPEIWRFPEPEELKASVMLALAHGSKGITISCYDGWGTADYLPPHQDLIYIQGIVDTLVNGNIEVTDLWYLIRDNLAPRLKGKLGKTLLDLEYTGNYINKYCHNCPNPDENIVEDYLTINLNTSDYFWHAGFFKKQNFPDDKYFLLANLWTTSTMIASLTINNNTVYHNLRFTDVEDGIDTTIDYNSYVTYSDSMLAGEGELYQVAPVVKYGGKLIPNETISGETTLIDEMVIQNGATLTINSTYNADRDIRIKAGGRIVTTNGGTIKFYEGHKLIVEGAATLSGTYQHKFVIDFISPENSNGIVIKLGGSLSISYCEIKNAVRGINSELNANYLNAQSINFIDCDSISINILGRSPGMAPTPPPQIQNCTITNSQYGISVANFPAY